MAMLNEGKPGTGAEQKNKIKSTGWLGQQAERTNVQISGMKKGKSWMLPNAQEVNDPMMDHSIIGSQLKRMEIAEIEEVLIMNHMIRINSYFILFTGKML